MKGGAIQTIPWSLPSEDLHSAGGCEMCTGQGLRDDSLMGRWQGTSLEFAFTKCYRYKDIYIFGGAVGELYARFNGNWTGAV